MPKFKFEGNYVAVIGIQAALTQIRAAGPCGRTLISSIESNSLQTVFEAVENAPKYKDSRGVVWTVPLEGAGGGVTLIPKHKYANGDIKVILKFSSMKSYKAIDGTRVPLTKTLLIAHELGHCKLIGDGHASHGGVQGSPLGQRLAIETINPVYVELGAKQRDPAAP